VSSTKKLLFQCNSSCFITRLHSYCFPTILFATAKIPVPAPISKILPLPGCCELINCNLFFRQCLYKMVCFFK
jgi:hypothetical protein